MDRIALILAAGKGSRMGQNKNKQFINICHKPLIAHTISAFNSSESIDKIVIVSGKDEEELIKSIVKEYGFNKVVSIVPGGLKRQESVLKGLLEIKENYSCSVVLIHDGARPFISEKIIDEGICLALKYGASACGVKPKDTIKTIDKDNMSKSTLNREELFSVQTPQCFKFNLILKCHEKVKDDNNIYTDDTAVLEKCGYKVRLYEGSYSNIKLTTPIDLVVAEEIFKRHLY